MESDGAGSSAINGGSCPPCGKRRRQEDISIQEQTMTDYDHLPQPKQVVSTSSFLHFQPSKDIFHTERVDKKTSNDTLYKPLYQHCFVNTTRYDEVLFDSGDFFIADDHGLYAATVKGMLMLYLQNIDYFHNFKIVHWRNVINTGR